MSFRGSSMNANVERWSRCSESTDFSLFQYTGKLGEQLAFPGLGGSMLESALAARETCLAALPSFFSSIPASLSLKNILKTWAKHGRCINVLLILFSMFLQHELSRKKQKYSLSPRKSFIFLRQFSGFAFKASLCCIHLLRRCLLRFCVIVTCTFS